MPNFHYVNNELVQLTDAEEAAFKADQDRHAADRAANGYKQDRAAEYPSVVDQLDNLPFWNRRLESEDKGNKDKYPKP